MIPHTPVLQIFSIVYLYWEIKELFIFVLYVLLLAPYARVGLDCDQSIACALRLTHPGRDGGETLRASRKFISCELARLVFEPYEPLGLPLLFARRTIRLRIAPDAGNSNSVRVDVSLIMLPL